MKDDINEGYASRDEMLTVKAASQRHCANRAERRAYEKKYKKEKAKYAHNKNSNRSHA